MFSSFWKLKIFESQHSSSPSAQKLKGFPKKIVSKQKSFLLAKNGKNVLSQLFFEIKKKSISQKFINNFLLLARKHNENESTREKLIESHKTAKKNFYYLFEIFAISI